MMKDESENAGSARFGVLCAGDEDGDQLIRLDGQFLRVWRITYFGMGQYLEPICRLVEFLQAAFHLADELCD